MAKHDDPRASRPRAARTTVSERRAKSAEAARVAAEARSERSRKGAATRRRNRQVQGEQTAVAEGGAGEQLASLDRRLAAAVEAGVRAAHRDVPPLQPLYYSGAGGAGDLHTTGGTASATYSGDEPSPDYARSDMNPGEDTIAREQGQVQGSIEGLMYATDRLEAVIGNLHAKLAPVLLPPGQAEPTPGDSDHPVDVIREVESLTSRIRLAGSAIVDLTERTAL